MTPTRWEQGRADVDDLLSTRRLERVTPSDAHAELLLTHARRHLASAHVILETDSELAFSAAYDAARKALSAVLAVQGLRATSAGGHVAVFDAVRAQLDPPLGSTIRPFQWMRRTRNLSEYPSPDSASIEADDVEEAIRHAAAIIDLAERVLRQLPPY